MKATTKPVRPEDDDGFKTPIISQNGDDPYDGEPCVLRWCVSVKVSKDGASVRDTKDPTKHTFQFDRGEWNAFIAAVKAGQYDLPQS